MLHSDNNIHSIIIFIFILQPYEHRADERVLKEKAYLAKIQALLPVNP